MERTALGQRFSLGETVVTIAGRRLELAHPVSVDDLLDEDDYDRHQRLPYWGTLWPSARMLAARVADAEGHQPENRRPPRDSASDGFAKHDSASRASSRPTRRLLELGCGVGLVSLAGALAGFEVLATDYYEDALEFVAANAARNGLSVQTRAVDWRHYPADLLGFDLVVASDVLYERPSVALVAAAISQSLAPEGMALITDPGRQVVRPFAQECRQRGLRCECVELEQVADGPIDAIVELYEISWRNSAAGNLG